MCTRTVMGKKYKEPTVYRDKKCPYCDYYFTPRGLNGHIRFVHEGYGKQEITGLKERLFKRAIHLLGQGHKELEPIIHRLGTYSDASLDELHEIEDTLDNYK